MPDGQCVQILNLPSFTLSICPWSDESMLNFVKMHGALISMESMVLELGTGIAWSKAHTEAMLTDNLRHDDSESTTKHLLVLVD